MKYIFLCLVFLCGCGDDTDLTKQRIKELDSIREQGTECFQAGGVAYYHAMATNFMQRRNYCVFRRQ